MPTDSPGPADPGDPRDPPGPDGPACPDGFDRVPQRLVEIWVPEAGTGSGTHGSGWVVRGNGVLTAAHLFPDGAGVGLSCEVRPGRLPGNTPWFRAELRWLDRGRDLALLAVTDPDWQPPTDSEAEITTAGDRVRYGCEVVGFPSRERLPDGSVDVFQRGGTLLPAQGARSGPTMRLELDGGGGAAAPAGGWSGISGAAVRDQAGRLVGVVLQAARHLPGSLLVAPVGPLAQLRAYQDALWNVVRDTTVRGEPRVDLHRVLREQIIALLADSPWLSPENTRALMAVELTEALGLETPIPNHSSFHVHCREIVRTCLARAAGAQELAVMYESNGDDPRKSRQLRQLADEWDSLRMLHQDDWVGLREVLSRVPVTTLSVHAPELPGEFLREGAGAGQQEPTHCDTAWHVLTYLLGANRVPGTLPVGMRFVEAVARVAGPHAQDLQRINRQWAVREQLGEALDDARFPWHRHPDSSATAYLVIQLEPDPLDPDVLELTGHFQEDPHGWAPIPAGRTRRVNRDQLGGAVEQLVEALWESGPPRRVGLTLEFLLPLELLDIPVEALSDGVKPPLMARHSVVVRSLERARGEYYHVAWRERWGELVLRSTDCLLHWCEPEPSALVDRLAEEAALSPRMVGAVLRERPPLSRDELRVALKAGLPVVLWHREGRYDGAFRQVVRDLTTGDGLAHLPARARELRMQSFRDDGTDAGSERLRDAGRNLVLIWDDPGRLPELGARGRTG